MKHTIAVTTLILVGCASGPLPWAQGPQLNESACAASCNAHYRQCPQVFANFPERGAVECPAEHDNCLKACESRPAAASAAGPATVSRPPDPTALPATPERLAPVAGHGPAIPSSSVPSKEARLRELKHLYDEGLVSDDVYRDRQRAILSEP